MELKFTEIVNRDKRAAEMLLYGDLGNEINGHYFAQELAWLGRECDEITIRINSNGGSVSHGLSIVSAMMASQAVIIAHIEGIAASMAAVVPVAADKVVINDYAKIMIHSPFYVDENGEMVKNLSAKDRKGLKAIKEILSELLEKRAIEKEGVVKMMRTDSWFTAEEAKEANLVDEIKTTKRKGELAALEPLQLVAKLNTEISNKNQKSMKKVFAKLGLAEDATEDQVVAAIDKIEAKAPETNANEVLVDKLVAVAKKAGRITDKNEAKVKALAETDMELFCDFIGVDALAFEAEEGKEERLSDIVAEVLKKSGKGKGAQDDEKDWAWYEKNDPQALAKMETAEPDKFKALKEADEAKYKG